MHTTAKAWRLRVLAASLAGSPMDGKFPATDVFHATDHVLPPLRTPGRVLTVYDITFRLFPEYHLPLNRWYSTLMLPRFVRHADAVIAISESTRRDLIAWTGVPSEKVVVTPLGVNPAFTPQTDEGGLAAMRARCGLPERFLLYFGTIEPRKNLTGLVEAYARLRANGADTPPLVIAGKKGWRYEPVFTQVRTLGLEQAVIFTDWVDSSDVPALLSAAEIFVYPSFYEGFGLPVLEAMACGTPVITSNVSSLPEVAGDAALSVDPRDPAALATAMMQVLEGPALQANLRARGLERAAQFTWRRTALLTHDIYRSVVKDRRA